MERVKAIVSATLVAWASLAAVTPLPLCAQTRVAGRVVRPDVVDSSPVPGARVVLHRVGRVEQGPIDSTVTDVGGRFRLRFRADTSALYLLSANYHDIEYFSTPVATNPERPDTAVEIVVADTSSRAPVEIEARHLVVPRPREDGSRSVLDMIVLRNSGTVTRIAPDSVRPSWSAPLPPGTLGLEAGQGDVLREAVERRGDSLLVFAPIAPGEKQLTVEYLIPGDRREVVFPFGQEVATVNLLVEDPGAGVSGLGAAAVDTQVIEGRTFRRFTGPVPAGGTLRVTLPGAGATPTGVLVALIASVALALAAATWRLVRTRPAAASPTRSPEALLNAIAALDDRYLGHEHEVGADEWERYRAERARLKSELEASLAGRSGRSS